MVLNSDAGADAALSSVQSAAVSRLSANLAGGGDAPAPVSNEPAAPAPAEIPSAAPAAPAQAAPAPAPPVAAPPQTPAIDPASLSPEARRFLEMKGGDLNRALTDALDYNNRLGAQAQPGTGAPTQEPAIDEPLEPPEAEVAPDPKVVEEHVRRLVGTDPVLVQANQRYDTLQADIERLDTELAEIATEQQRLQWRLGLPETDEITKDEIKRDLRDKKLDAQTLRAEQREKQADSKDLVRQFRERQGQYRERVAGHLRDQSAQAWNEQQSARRIETHTNALAAAWPGALKAAATAHGLDTDTLRAKLDARAQVYALANLERGLAVEQVGPFFDQIAREMKEEVEEFHREQSAEHARLAHQRAAAVAGGTPPAGASGQPPAPSGDNKPIDLRDVYKRAGERLRANLPA